MTDLPTLAGRPTFRRPKPAQTAWGKPAASAPRQQGQQQQQQQQQKAQAVHGNGFTNQGWSDDEDPELHPDGEHGAQKEADEGYTEQVQPTVKHPPKKPNIPHPGAVLQAMHEGAIFSLLPCILE